METKKRKNNGNERDLDFQLSLPTSREKKRKESEKILSPSDLPPQRENQGKGVFSLSFLFPHEQRGQC